MTRSDLVEELAARFSQLTHRDAEFAVKTLLDAMGEALVRGHRIELRGFGSFSINRRPPRMGRNPRSGESVARELWPLDYHSPVFPLVLQGSFTSRRMLSLSSSACEFLSASRSASRSACCSSSFIGGRQPMYLPSVLHSCTAASGLAVPQHKPRDGFNNPRAAGNLVLGRPCLRLR